MFATRAGLGTAVVASLLTTLLTTLATTASPALASPASAASGGPVGTRPAAYTPWLLRTTANQNVQQLQQCGGSVYAVGTISAVGQGTRTYTRHNAFSFSAATGAVTSWAPNVQGSVHSVAFSPDCSTAYLGGTFSSVNGVAATNIAAVNTTTGALRAGFAHAASAEVDTVRYAAGAVVAGGKFTTINGASRSHLASLDPATGAPTSYLDLAVTGTYPSSSVTKVYNSQLSHSGDKLLIEGVFTSIAGQPRQQVAVLDLGASAGTVDPWNAPELDQQCVATESFYAKGASWSPDDSSIYVATTGYKPADGSTTAPRSGLCDAAVAFPASRGTVSHSWINYTGCDSLYAVAADPNDVYVGGHERWANNPNGCDAAGSGAQPRPGIGALSPTSGLATAWNPTRGRGHGVNDLLLTSKGLWVASDNGPDGAVQKCGGQTNHGGICFFAY